MMTNPNQCPRERDIFNTLKDVASGHYSPEEGYQLIMHDLGHTPAPKPAAPELATWERAAAEEIWAFDAKGAWPDNKEAWIAAVTGIIAKAAGAPALASEPRCRRCGHPKDFICHTDTPTLVCNCADYDAPQRAVDMC